MRGRTSAGGIVVRVADGRPLVALTREGNWPLFVLPKGGVEEGETFEEAARREIEEESGLRDLTLVRYIGKLERMNFARSRWMTVHYYLFRTTQVDGVPTDSAHHTGVWWFPPDDLPEMLWPEQVSLIQQQLDAIRRLAEDGHSA